MKTTPEKAQAYIQNMPRAALELLARNVLNVVALEHDEKHDPAVLTDSKVQDSMCDAYDSIDDALRRAGLTIHEIRAFQPPAPVGIAAPASRFHAFHWPDHVIGKRESRRIRDEHNALYNSHHELLTALRCSLASLDSLARSVFDLSEPHSRLIDPRNAATICAAREAVAHAERKQ